jgi:hypothetical protein
MKQILVVGEDPLTCALGERLVAELLPEWSVPFSPINTKGITKWPWRNIMSFSAL